MRHACSVAGRRVASGVVACWEIARAAVGGSVHACTSGGGEEKALGLELRFAAGFARGTELVETHS